MLENLEGDVVLLRVSAGHGQGVDLLARPRPLPPYPPFHEGDVEYPALLAARLKIEAAAAASKGALDRLGELGVWTTVRATRPESIPKGLPAVRPELRFGDDWKGTDEDWKLLEAIEHPEQLMLHLNTDHLAGLAQVHLAQPLTKITLLLPSNERLMHVERLPACRWVVLEENNLSPAGYRKVLSLIPDAEKLQWKGSSYAATDEVMAELAERLPHLVSLSIQNPIKAERLDAIGKLVNLKELAISTYAANPDRFEPLAQLTRLQRLTIGPSLAERKAADRQEEIPMGDAIARLAGALPTLQVLDVGMLMSPQGLAAIAGAERLQALQAEISQVDHASITALGRLSRLRVLRLSGEGRLSDAGLAPLEQLRLLTDLDLPGQGLTDAAMLHLAPLSDLKSLKLAGGQFTGSGLAALQPLKRLWSLDLSGSRFDDDGCRQLTEVFAKLGSLNLNRTRITDSGAFEIAKLLRLINLDLSGTAVTDAGLAELAKLPNLRVLSLEATRITDAGLAALRQTKELNWLRVNETGVTPQGVAATARRCLEPWWLTMHHGSSTTAARRRHSTTSRWMAMRHRPRPMDLQRKSKTGDPWSFAFSGWRWRRLTRLPVGRTIRHGTIARRSGGSKRLLETT